MLDSAVGLGSASRLSPTLDAARFKVTNTFLEMEGLFSDSEPEGPSAVSEAGWVVCLAGAFPIGKSDVVLALFVILLEWT